MAPELALKLVSIFEAYFDGEELRDLSKLFAVRLDSLEAGELRWLAVASELISRLEHGNTRRLVDNLLDLAEMRCSDGVAHTSWDTQDFNRSMASVIRDAREILAATAAPSEIAIVAGSIFSAKSKVRELLETASEEVFIVDPYIGLGTLDCVRGLAIPVRILTSIETSAIEKGFERALSDYASESHQIEIRRAPGLHDRHLVFNERCWLIGGSLKDAGKKPFHCIEIVDKRLVIDDLEERWRIAERFPPIQPE